VTNRTTLLRMGTALAKPVLPMFERESTMIEVRTSPLFATTPRDAAPRPKNGHRRNSTRLSVKCMTRQKDRSWEDVRLARDSARSLFSSTF
jgi:hypothetical protein